MVADHAVLAVHRNAGKVAHMLVGAGQLVEQRGFAAVLIAGQGKGQRCTGGNGGAGFALVVAGHFNGGPHGGRFAQRYLGAGGQPHIQQVVAQLALTAYHADDCILPNVQVT